MTEDDIKECVAQAVEQALATAVKEAVAAQMRSLQERVAELQDAQHKQTSRRNGHAPSKREVQQVAQHRGGQQDTKNQHARHYLDALKTLGHDD